MERASSRDLAAAWEKAVVDYDSVSGDTQALQDKLSDTEMALLDKGRESEELLQGP